MKLYYRININIAKWDYSYLQLGQLYYNHRTNQQIIIWIKTIMALKVTVEIMEIDSTPVLLMLGSTKNI